MEKAHLLRVRRVMVEQLAPPPLHVRPLEAGQLSQDVPLKV